MFLNSGNNRCDAQAADGSHATLAADFAAAMARLAAPGQLAVAVSGGGDSLALVLLTRDWLGGNDHLLALIVDHGLRAEAAREAGQTARLLGGLGIAACVLTLSDLPKGAGLQEAARNARYAALGRAARAAGFLHLLLGHHQQDQSETVAMRAQRGSRGLEGMAGWAARNDVVLLRPLLGIAPARLRAFLQQRGIGWIEDPANRNQRFERARIRIASPSTPVASPAARWQREQDAAAYLARHVLLSPLGYAVADTDHLPPAALAAVLRIIGGRVYAPRLDRVASLAARLRPATLGGVHIAPAGRLGPGWLFAREAAACAAPVPAAPGVLWDRRFQLRGEPRAGLTLGALGAQAKRGAYDLPALVLRTLPCLRDAGRLVDASPPVLFTPPAPAACHNFSA